MTKLLPNLLYFNSKNNMQADASQGQARSEMVHIRGGHANITKWDHMSTLQNAVILYGPVVWTTESSQARLATCSATGRPEQVYWNIEPLANGSPKASKAQLTYV